MLSIISRNKIVLLFTVLLVSIQIASAYQYVVNASLGVADCVSTNAAKEDTVVAAIGKFNCKPTFTDNVVEKYECPPEFKGGLVGELVKMGLKCTISGAPKLSK